MNGIARQWRASAVLILAMIMGCATGQKRDDKFFTSGSREADQRADQRMAKSEQLAGGGEGAGDKSPQSNEKKTLYERLGGSDGIKQITDDFVTRALDDPRVNWQRKGVKEGGFSIHHNKSEQWDASPANIQKLKEHLAEFFALATGGPSEYHGKEMKEAHAGLHITNDEFDASIGDLKASLDKFKIPNQEQKELLSIIESTRAQIAVER